MFPFSRSSPIRGINKVGVAMDDERQMSTLHPKQRGEHAGASCDS